MHLKRIELVNFKGITKFESDFAGNVYLITGENELGKSSILEAIVRILKADREAVLKNGTDKGHVIMDIGDYNVEWKFTEKNPRGTMTIKTPDGMKSDNVSMLQNIFKYQDFDAQEFISWSETADGRRKQVEAVKRLLPEPVQVRIKEIEAETSKKYDERKEANATLKTYKTLEDNAFKVLPNTPEKYAEPIDVEELLELQKKETKLEANYQTAKERKKEREAQIANIPTRKKELEESKTRMESGLKERAEKAKSDYEEAIRKAKENFENEEKAIAKETEELAAATIMETEQIESDLKEYTEKLGNAVQFIETYEKAKEGSQTVAEKLAKVNEHNDNHKRYKEYQEAQKNRANAAKKVEELETALTQLAAEKEELIKTSNLPIDGLNFTDDGLELNGVPFAHEKVSDSQIMEVVTSLIIASNPTTKIFRIARGESLGTAKLKALVELSTANGFQGFIEEVHRGQNELIVEEYTEK